MKREFYLEHYDPERWPVEPSNVAAASSDKRWV
jgi:hypothetical protein